MKKYIKLLIAATSLIIIFLLPVFLIVWQYNLFLPASSNIEISKLSNKDFSNYQEGVLGFLLNRSELPKQMTELEKLHMEDVKKLFLSCSLILFFSIFVFLLLFILGKKKDYLSKAWEGLKISGFFSLFIIILLLFFSLFNFDNLFVYFHKIFFPQGNWMFPASSLMIQVFPEELFKSLTISSFISSFILASFAFFLSLVKLKK